MRNKNDDEINFKVFHTNQCCILATRDEEKTEVIDGVAVHKIPYYKLAVYLDLKAIPALVRNDEGVISDDVCPVISSDSYQRPSLS